MCGVRVGEFGSEQSRGGNVRSDDDDDENTKHKTLNTKH
jgi:hypothetical protein